MRGWSQSTLHCNTLWLLVTCSSWLSRFLQPLPSHTCWLQSCKKLTEPQLHLVNSIKQKEPFRTFARPALALKRHSRGDSAIRKVDLYAAGNGMVPVNNMSMSNGSSMTSVGVNGSASPSITGGNVIPQLPELPSSGLPGAAGPQGQYALNPPADGSGSGDQQDPAYLAKQRQKKQEFILKQQRWLLFLRHCAKCQYPDGQCNYGSSCAVAKQLWQHILGCSDARCEYPRYPSC